MNKPFTSWMKVVVCSALGALATLSAHAQVPCVVPDNGSGTVTLPPQGCSYLSPTDVHQIAAGLPAGTTIVLTGAHHDFACGSAGTPPAGCSFVPSPACQQPGGTLGGEEECSNSTLSLNLQGTGTLAGWNRSVSIPVSFETHVGPRTPFQPIQQFPTDMYNLQGQLPPGDPDFDLLRITGGTSNGMPSPGQTKLTKQGPNWKVDSFFDITYRIDFVGHAGGHLGGMSGSTTATIRMATGGTPCAPGGCDDGNPCTTDACDTSRGICSHVQISCDDGQICTDDVCNPATGLCSHTATGCDDGNACTVDGCAQALVAPPPCVVTDNGSGTVTLPPAGCDYLSPTDVHQIVNGLPAGTTIQLGAIHRKFICGQSPASICSFGPPIPGVDCDQPGGSLGGDEECSDSELALTIHGTGTLSGWNRTITLPVGFETHTGPRTPGAPTQSFDTEMFRLFGQAATGDPDFDLLRITAGNDFGLPSPGHTTLRSQAGGTWVVDSFFDITYRIDFVGHPGGHIGGMSGSTTGTIRMQTGQGVGCTHTPVNCDDGNPCTLDSCDPVSGCVHSANTCDDGNACTDDSCAQGLVVSPACTVTGSGGTVTLPPAGCDYLSPSDVHEIINGLPAGTTIEFGAIHRDFICNQGAAGGGPCSFVPPPGTCEQNGGSLGGKEECAGSSLSLALHGTGALTGWDRTLAVPVNFETHVAPRTPGTPVQSFDTQMFALQGQLPAGDPDFDLLRITAGNSFGMPSPGHTTLRFQSGGQWHVDSFFDITYRIDFVGHSGGHIGGMSGSTTGTIRMATGNGDPCVHTPHNCDDGNPCTVDSCTPASGCVHTLINCDDGQICTNDACNPATGLCTHTAVSCDDGNPCTTDSCVQAFAPNTPPCTVPDNGGGTVTLPPAGCDYLSPQDVHDIINGLPAGTTIQFGAIHKDFICGGHPGAPSICSFVPPPGTCDQPGGTLGGNEECSQSTLAVTLNGTGTLTGYNRTIQIPVEFETHVGPRTPGSPSQSFATEMFRLQGQLPAGDPDFDLLRVTAGNDFGLPSPGHTTLTQQGTSWKVDSFFDITYRIDFVGHPGGPLGGMSGSTTGTIRMQTGSGVGCVHNPITAPPETQSVVAAANKTTFSWAQAEFATQYDVVRGALANLPVGPGGGDEICFDNLPAPTVDDPSPNPLSGQGRWYLSRGENSCGNGTYGTTHTGTPRTTTTCP